jgi:hypothetical protein
MTKPRREVIHHAIRVTFVKTASFKGCTRWASTNAQKQENAENMAGLSHISHFAQDI